jgi:SAM-dependent methyltransferase
VCGYSKRELERLVTQAEFFKDITGSLFAKAGLASGMRVLDIGCGVGDVSFLAADMVGPSGSVLGIDHAAEPIAAATARAAASGVANVEFRLSGIGELTLDAPVDALVGRFVLMHQADPPRALRDAARHVRPGGLVVILESHLSAWLPDFHSSPHSPTYDRIVRWLVEVIGTGGAHTDMGLRLRRVFIDAGLPAPELWLQARVEGGRDAAIYSYITESLRSMLPLAERFGIATLSMGDVDELERQLREEVTGSGGVLTSPIVVGAWCRVGQQIDAETG